MKPCAAFVLLLVSSALPAFAADPTKEAQAEAKAHFDEAQKQYKLGRFEEAFIEYQRAYELAPFADLLFNMGQCRRNLKDYERALFFFKSYVRDAPRAEDRARVNQLITQLEEERAREVIATRPVETSSATVAQNTTIAVVDEPVTVPSDSVVTSNPQPELVRDPLQNTAAIDDPIYSEWWFWTAIAVVAAAAVGGTIVATKSDDSAPMGSIGTISATED